MNLRASRNDLLRSLVFWGRFNVNNLGGKRWEQEEVGVIYSSVGRTFQFSINARF